MLMMNIDIMSYFINVLFNPKERSLLSDELSSFLDRDSIDSIGSGIAKKNPYGKSILYARMGMEGSIRRIIDVFFSYVISI